MSNNYKEDYYEILGISRDADEAAIKKAYREKMRYYHPDNQNISKDAAEAMSKLINEAYEVLSDKDKKADYDSYYDAKKAREQFEADLDRQVKEARKKAQEAEAQRQADEAKKAEEARKKAEAEAAAEKKRQEDEEAARKAEKKRKKEEREQRKAARKARWASRWRKITGQDDEYEDEFDDEEISDKKDMTPFNKAFAKFQLSREPKKGKTKSPIKVWGKRIIAGVLVVVIAGTAYWLGTRKNQNSGDAILPEEPGITGTLDPNDSIDRGGEIGTQDPDDQSSKDDEEEQTVSQGTGSQSTGGSGSSTGGTGTGTGTGAGNGQTSDAGVSTITEASIDSAAASVYSNWSQFTSSYTKDNIKELIKCLNGIESSMSIDTADDILLDMLNFAITPGINNAIIGSQKYQTHALDFSALFLDGAGGVQAVIDMERYLNGSLTDAANLLTYAQDAFIDEAILIGENGSVGGMNLASGTPAARLVWSRLAIGVNGVAGTLGDSLVVEINGRIYTQDDLNNASVLEEIATSAKRDLGNSSKTMDLN